MRGGCAVEADSGLDAEAVVQRKGDVGKVAARRLDGDDARAALYAGEAKQFDTFSRAERREAREETLCERQFMRADGVQTGVRKEAERGVEPGDAGEVHRPGFEAVRQENGAPAYRFSGRTAEWVQARSLTARLSLSHEGGMALAFCTLETET